MNRHHAGRKIASIAASIFYVGAGTLHFLRPHAYVKIVPPWIPAPLAMVYLSGLGEIAGGIGLLAPAIRRTAAWALVALLIAVFPANVYMAVDRISANGHPLPDWLLWGRLPLQFVLIWWLLWCTKPTMENRMR